MNDDFADFGSYGQKFKYPHPAEVSGAAAVVAPGAFVGAGKPFYIRRVADQRLFVRDLHTLEKLADAIPDGSFVAPVAGRRLMIFGGVITRLHTDPNKGMAGRCAQGLIDVLEQNYGGDISQMPYVVNKEAFAKDKKEKLA